MNNLVQSPMQTSVGDPIISEPMISEPMTGDILSDQRWPERSEKFRPDSSLCYSALFSILSPISAIGVLALLNHFWMQH